MANQQRKEEKEKANSTLLIASQPNLEEDVVETGPAKGDHWKKTVINFSSE